ncbi:hypothetical protein E2C01_006233 [Portunus trituberculatus]|uniref:Uncharacterized protein n=1 Tax=Portunus trituberculatus TaxID=210409 RepID=A0A5B7CWK2_PORTR|nr:hypothetical protein [Portunus trituberculatus]
MQECVLVMFICQRNLRENFIDHKETLRRTSNSRQVSPCETLRGAKLSKVPGKRRYRTGERFSPSTTMSWGTHGRLINVSLQLPHPGRSRHNETRHHHHHHHHLRTRRRECEDQHDLFPWTAMTRCPLARPQNSSRENTLLTKTFASGPIRSRNLCNRASNNQEAARTVGEGYLMGRDREGPGWM